MSGLVNRHTSILESFLYLTFFLYLATDCRFPDSASLTRDKDYLAFEPILICPECAAVYLGEESTNRSRCGECNASLEGVHPINEGLPMPDMVAIRRSSITADEEERRRKGFRIDTYYQSDRPDVHSLQVGGDEAARLAYEHNGRTLTINVGPVQAKECDEPPRFNYCPKCNTWLLSRESVAKHADEDTRASDQHCHGS